MAYIQVIQDDEADGLLREVYDEIIEKRGQLSEVLKIQSLNPQSICDHVNLYMTTMFGKSPLRRAQREMIAVVVSLNNECPYCVTHHATALNHFWKDEERLRRFQNDFRDAELSEQDILLCEYAALMTRKPSEMNAAHADRLKAADISDRMIHDATLIISYFNFVNRMVLGLGAELEQHEGAGFKYD